MTLAATGLTACGGSGDSAKGSSSDDTYTVTVAYVGDKKEDTDRIEKKINEIMKRDINMQIDIEPISWGAYSETMKLILSGGEKMDIVPVLVDQANSMVNAKQIIDLSDYIDKYGDNIKELLGDTAKAANINNYVYGVTTGREWFCQTSVIMRQDILDDCGIDPSSITSYKDLTDVYATVKEKYPDMIMMASNNSTTPDVKYEMFDTLTDGFGVLMDHGQDTTVVDYYESDEYKDFVETCMTGSRKVICPKMRQLRQKVWKIRSKPVRHFLTLHRTNRAMIPVQNCFAAIRWPSLRSQKHGREPHRSPI